LPLRQPDRARRASHRGGGRAPRVRAEPAAGHAALVRCAAYRAPEVRAGLGRDPQGAHRERGVRRGQLALPRARHARLRAAVRAGARRPRASRELQARRFASTLTYMRASSSMSATRTHSLTLWIEALTTPSSTTSAPSGAMKRPSEVPPPVESCGETPP